MDTLRSESRDQEIIDNYRRGTAAGVRGKILGSLLDERLTHLLGKNDPFGLRGWAGGLTYAHFMRYTLVLENIDGKR